MRPPQYILPCRTGRDDGRKDPRLLPHPAHRANKRHKLLYALYLPLLPREERWRKLLIINYCACNRNSYGFYISLNVPNGVAAVRACAETCYVVCRCLIDDNGCRYAELALPATRLRGTTMYSYTEEGLAKVDLKPLLDRRYERLQSYGRFSDTKADSR